MKKGSSPLKALALPFILFLTLASLPAQGQQMISLKWFGLSIHPLGAVNAALEPLKLDPKGVFVPNLGAVMSWEYALLPWLTVKLAQGAYFDCALKPAGFSHIGLRGYFVNFKNTVIGGGIGPTWIYRKTWTDIPGYIPYSFFENAGAVDWAFLWYGGDFEWNQRIRGDLWLSLCLVPGWPDLINLSAGLKWVL